MFKKLKIILFSLIWALQIFTEINVNAQSTNILAEFTATRNSTEIILNWVIAKGNTCNGIAITRSNDSLNFVEIGDIEGICGDEERAVSYLFTDENPVRNMRNFYRLELGSVGSSEVVGVDFPYFSDKGFSVRPNPAYNEATVYFLNPDKNEHEISVYNLNGMEVLRTESAEDNFVLNRKLFGAGMYLFSIKNKEGDRINGKVLLLN